MQLGLKRFERVLRFLEAAAANASKIVCRDCVTPRREAAVATKAGEMRDDPDEDLLSGIARVFGMPEHSQREPIDLILHAANELFDGGRIAGAGSSNQRSMRVAADGHCSSSSFKRLSSASRVRTWASKAPSSNSSGSGGAYSTKL